MARHGGPLPGTARVSGMNAAAHSGKVMAGTQGTPAAQGANGAAQPAHPVQPSAANPQALTPAVRANNAAAEHKKPPSTQPVRKERREPHGGVRLASPTAQKWRPMRPSCTARGTFPSWNNPEAEPPGIVFVPDARARLTAAWHRRRIFIDIIVLF
jgi:hypothetical protein